jgi:hypothetical protein
MLFTRSPIPATHAVPETNSVKLSKNITGLRLTQGLKANQIRTVLTELPKDALLTIYGDGFNARTLMVRWRESMYYVFSQDCF